MKFPKRDNILIAVCIVAVAVFFVCILLNIVFEEYARYAGAAGFVAGSAFVIAAAILAGRRCPAFLAVGAAVSVSFAVIVIRSCVIADKEQNATSIEATEDHETEESADKALRVPNHE